MQRFGGKAGQPKEMACSLAEAQIEDMPRGQKLISRVYRWTTWCRIAEDTVGKADEETSQGLTKCGLCPIGHGEPLLAF